MKINIMRDFDYCTTSRAKRALLNHLQKLWLYFLVVATPFAAQANYVSIAKTTTLETRLSTSMQSVRATLWNAMGMPNTVLSGKALYGGGDFSLDFVAAEPYSYNHSTGGGAFDDRTVGTDIVESLEGGDFSCGDIVTFFTKVKVDAGATGAQTIGLDYSFLADATGQSGVALADIMYVGVNYGAVSGGDGAGGTDAGISDDGGSVATLSGEHITGDGTLFNDNDLVGTVTVTDLEAGETVVVRVDVLIACDPGSSPTGNLQGAITAGLVIDPEDDNISVGNQTVPFKNVNKIQFPDCVLPAAGPVCAGATTTHTATSDVAAATYTWTISGTSSGAAFAGGGTTKTTTAAAGVLSSSVDVVAGGEGSYTLSVVISKRGYGDQSCNTVVVVNPNPVVYMLTGDDYCAGDAALGSLTLSDSEMDVMYQLKNAANVDVQAAKTGSGEALIWTGIAAGTGYYVVATGAAPSNCHTQTAPASVTENPLPNADAGTNKELTCTTTSINLSGSSTTAGVTYSWMASNGGHIVSGADSATPLVDAAGTYTLTVTNPATGCVNTDVVEVTRNANLPDINVHTNGLPVLRCDNTSVTLLGYSSIAGVTYSWTGPNGFTSTEQNPTITVAGTYTLTVTNPVNGCVASASIDISDQTQAPGANAGPDKELNCSITSVILEGSSESTHELSYQWYTLAGNIIPPTTEESITVDAPGTYVLRVTDILTSCFSTDTVEVTQDNTLPNVGILSKYNPRYDCEPIDTLIAVTSTKDAFLLWAGPGGFTSDEDTIVVTVEGEYSLTVRNPENGCSAMAKATVFFTKPAIADAGPDKVITCAATTVMLDGGFATDKSGLVVWEARDGGHIVSGRYELNPVVDAAGTYVLHVRGYINSCSTTDTVRVTSDFTKPNITAQGGTLDCDTGTLQLMGASTTEGVSYSWTGPDGYSTNEQNPIVSVAGEYTLTVTASSNGCSSTMAVMVLAQPTVPQPEIVCYEINFDTDEHGLITSTTTEAGVVDIFGRKRNPDGSIADENHAAIFDSQAPTGDDDDLYTTDWGNVLIINQDLGDEPNDNQWGGALIVDFSAFGPVTMTSLKALDIDSYEDWSWVYLYDGDGNELYKVQLQPLGDNSKQTVDLGNTKGVMWMKVELDGTGVEYVGSGAIDDIRFCIETEGEDPCVRTAPATEILATAFPMPFADRTTVEFTSNADQKYTVQLFDSRGRMVKELKVGTARAGEIISVEVDGRDLPNGMYIAHIVGESGVKKSIKLINRK
ncbi:T9SS type A sorting domain-containing protein [Pontibacter fetidus]|uniref:T9SS type A sorting domain-containing protein n=1 Tax=Pontibacter fetidus TaxID=2700082 RepID=A0A6B2HCD9_9BACT|nr:T9SS type A sorting domain-containing protein [Pontibacter fetidus]NDK57722.1 T9SS type A sorting domain-containing protein [Pontibacter fetidus]